MRVSNLRGSSLGAEELIELGQSKTSAALPISTPVAAAPSRTILISKAEGRLLIKVVENIIAFKDAFVVEYIAYCPQERWETTQSQVSTWVHEIEKQINAGAQQVAVPAEVLFRLVDLEKCISAARDARLTSARWAFGISAGAAIATTLLGWKWLSIPAYIAGLAILFGRPLAAKYNPDPQDPYQPAIKGASLGGVSRASLSGCAPPKETEEEKKRVKLIERIILPKEAGLKNYYWGEVDCSPMGRESSVCLKKGRFRVRIEGWEGDIVRPSGEWGITDDCEEALNVIGVWDVDGNRETSYGPIPEKSSHPETFWVEYVGPKTGGKIRRAGPFGCPLDTRDHGIDDGGIEDLGVDGDVVVFDENGEPVSREEVKA